MSTFGTDFSTGGGLESVASLTASGDVAAATVTAPVFRTTTAADVVFQRNSTEVARLTSTGLAVALGKVLEVYNVGTPGATNYERGSMNWAANVWTVGPQQGGTGVSRAADYLEGGGSGLRCAGSGAIFIKGSGGGFSSLQPFDDTIGLACYGKITTSTNAAVTITNNASGSGFTASSGTQRVCSISGTTAQSGSAAFIGLESDITPTATGSGTVYGLSVKRATVQVFGIDVKATLTNDADTVMWLTYFSSGVVKHARVTLGVDVAGQRNLRVAT